MAPDFKRVKEIFLAVVEKSTPAERDACLRAQCGPDASLLSHVEALLRKHDNAGDFLAPVAVMPSEIADTPVEFGAAIPAVNGAEALGSFIGPYRLLKPLGEGGMGMVYLAEQLQPVRRRVALKVIKAGMDSAQVIARFEQER